MTYKVDNVQTILQLYCANSYCCYEQWYTNGSHACCHTHHSCARYSPLSPNYSASTIGWLHSCTAADHESCLYKHHIRTNITFQPNFLKQYKLKDASFLSGLASPLLSKQHTNLLPRWVFISNAEHYKNAYTKQLWHLWVFCETRHKRCVAHEISTYIGQAFHTLHIQIIPDSNNAYTRVFFGHWTVQNYPWATSSTQHNIRFQTDDQSTSTFC